MKRALQLISLEFQRTLLKCCTANCSDITKDVYKSWRCYHITYSRCFTAEVTQIGPTEAGQHQNWKWYNPIRQKEPAARMAKLLPLCYKPSKMTAWKNWSNSNSLALIPVLFFTWCAFWSRTSTYKYRCMDLSVVRKVHKTATQIYKI